MTQHTSDSRVVSLLPGSDWYGIPGFYTTRKNQTKAYLAAAVTPSSPDASSSQITNSQIDIEDERHTEVVHKICIAFELLTPIQPKSEVVEERTLSPSTTMRSESAHLRDQTTTLDQPSTRIAETSRQMGNKLAW